MRTYVNLWICFLLSGIWHGAAWNFVIWGAYNGLFLTLDRVFLARLLTRINPHVANLLTLLIIMFGWAIFRASTDRIGTFFMALFGLSSEGRSTIVIGTEVWITAAIGALICILPTTTVYLWLTKLYESSTTVRSLASMGLLLLFAIACARPMASQFQPFLYFRF
jgi:alginate O-acetyltransferase complex protein AlgI